MDCLAPNFAVYDDEQGKYVFKGSVKGDKWQPLLKRFVKGDVAERKYYHDSSGKYVFIPCGHCMACRLERSRDWAVRCVLESKMHKDNCFVTLTYDDAHLPSDYGLQKDDLTKFFKRLRKNTGAKLRYYACGEYGDLYSRPHYHICIFGWRPDDLILYTIRNGVNLYISETILRAWQGRGFVTVGDVTFESAAYVARYVTKKIYGRNAKEQYYQGREPEYTVMSRRPGIGTPFFEKYSTDIYGKDFIVIRDGIKCKPPLYFDRIYDRYYGDGAFEGNIKPNREFKSEKSFQRNLEEYTFDRITTRAKFKELRYKTKFRRTLEEQI